MLDTAGGSAFTMLDSTIPTQTATVQAKPTNSVRLGFAYQPAGSEVGVTANQFKLYLKRKSCWSTSSYKLYQMILR